MVRHKTETLLTSLVREALEQRGVSARAVALDAGLPVRSVQGVLEGHSPSIGRAAEICRALNLEFYIGPPRGGETAAPAADWTVLGEIEAPHHGVARCGVTGWGKDMPDRAPMQLPEAANDSEAFWVTAAGGSMKPEGIESNWLCLVSPGREPVPGDRVWLLDINNAASIKRLVSIEDDGRLMLRGWQNVRDGKQQSFNEERMPAGIKRVHPVIAVFRGRPGGDVFKHVPDPKAPTVPPVPSAAAPSELIDALGLSAGTSMADAIKAVEKRLEEARGLDAGAIRDEVAAVVDDRTAAHTETLRAEIEAVREGIAGIVRSSGERSVPVIGMTGANEQIVFGKQFGRAPAPPGADTGLVAVGIGAGGAGSLLRHGDRAYFNRDRRIDPGRDVGRLVVAFATDGSGWFGTLERGQDEGQWTVRGLSPQDEIMGPVIFQRITPVEWIHIGIRPDTGDLPDDDETFLSTA